MNNTLSDLNLLRIFSVLSEELNLTRSSKRLGLSQPALSHALKRLRADFSDSLFVRGSKGLVPTPRVSELIPKIRELLVLSEELYRAPEAVGFKKLKRSLVLGATTYFEIRVLDQLMKRLAEHAPNVTLETRSLQGGFPKEDLERGVIDIAVAAYFDKMPEGFRVRHLGRDPFVLVARKDHPYLRSRRRLEDYLAAKHLQIEVPPGAVAPIDRHLESLGKTRSIVARLGNFLSPPLLVASSDLLLTCPETLGRKYTEIASVEIGKLPITLPPLEVRMCWHERNHSDPFQSWLRDLIVTCMRPALPN